MKKAERESDIETYLITRVMAEGGETRKTKWIGRRGAPDRRVMLGRCGWAEVKRPGGKLEPHQEREIKRMQNFGEFVFVISTREEVDAMIVDLKYADNH